MARLAIVAALSVAALVQATSAARERRKVESLFDMDEATKTLEDTVAFTTEAGAAFEAVTSRMSSVDSVLSSKISETVGALKSEQIAKNTTLRDSLRTLEIGVKQKLAVAAEVSRTMNSTIHAEVAAVVARLNAEVKTKLASRKLAYNWPNGSFHPMWERNYELVKVARAPEQTLNGHQRRVFYKVNYNVNNPYYWWEDRKELKEACRDLSQDLQAIDGIDRQLKPVCDRGRDGGSTSYCNSDGVWLSNTYFSHCGRGCYNGRMGGCAGMSEDFLNGALIYHKEHSWWGNWRLLRHDRDCYHSWIQARGDGDRKATYTICTSSNAYKNVPPSNWCDPEDDNTCFCKGAPLGAGQTCDLD